MGVPDEALHELLPTRTRRFAHRLANGLEASGHVAWIDTEDITTSGEDRWRRSIVAGIAQADAVVVVLSPSSVTSVNVEREITIAADERKRLVPIVHQPCELTAGFTYELAGIQHVDFSTQPFDEALHELGLYLNNRERVPSATNKPAVPQLAATTPSLVNRTTAPTPTTARARSPRLDSRPIAVGAALAVALIGLAVALIWSRSTSTAAPATTTTTRPTTATAVTAATAAVATTTAAAPSTVAATISATPTAAITTASAPSTMAAIASSPTARTVADVPNVYNEAESTAVEQLRAAGFAVNVFKVCSGSVEDGRVRQVLVQSTQTTVVDRAGVLSAGRGVAIGTKLDVKVSNGRPC